jgi:hypothetical protein
METIHFMREKNIREFELSRTYKGLKMAFGE